MSHPTAAILLSMLVAVLLVVLARRAASKKKALHNSDAATEMARLKQFVRLSSEWYWEQDASYRFTWRSVWRLDEIRIRPADFLGKTRWEMPNSHSDLFWEAHKRTLAERRPFCHFEYQLQIGGRTYWASVSGEPVFSAEGVFLGYRGTGRDVTRAKAAEEALRISEERFEEMVNLMPVSLFVKDAESRVSFMNTECERQWGVRLDEVRGTDASTMFPGIHVAAFLSADRKAFAERCIVDYEETVWHAASHAERVVRTLKKPVFDESGSPRYLIGIHIDITERVRAEGALRASEESLRQLALHQSDLIEEERKRIARDIHDELGQNLLALRIDASRLSQRAGGQHLRLQALAQSALRTIDQTIRSVRQIINNLRPSVLDLGLPAALEWQVKEFAKHSMIECTADIRVDESALELNGDYATALFRVLQESLTNVQRHSGATTVHVSLHNTVGGVMLSVVDNGAGRVRKEDRPAGFGIQGMMERVRMLGGDLEIRDEPAGGTRLTVTLPLAIQPERITA